MFLSYYRRSCLSAIIKSSIFFYVPWFLILGGKTTYPTSSSHIEIRINISFIISYQDVDSYGVFLSHGGTPYHIPKGKCHSTHHVCSFHPIKLHFPMVKPPFFNEIFHRFFHGENPFTGGLPCVAASPEDDHVKREDGSSGSGFKPSFGVKLLMSK